MAVYKNTVEIIFLMCHFVSSGAFHLYIENNVSVFEGGNMDCRFCMKTNGGHWCALGFFFFPVLGIEPRASHILDKCSTPELQHQPL